MVVVTEYAFDAAAWRAGAGPGPGALAVDVGTAGHDSSRLPIAPGPLRLDPGGPAGVRRIVLTGDGEPFALGDVEFAFSPEG